MKPLTKIIIGVLLWGSGGWAWSEGIVSDLPARQEAGKVMADLRLNYGQLQMDQKDLATAQQSLTVQILTYDQRKKLLDRIQKDQTNIQDDLKAVLSDLSFLLSNWAYLTQEDKDFVSRAEGAI